MLMRGGAACVHAFPQELEAQTSRLIVPKANAVLSSSRLSRGSRPDHAAGPGPGDATVVAGQCEGIVVVRRHSRQQDALARRQQAPDDDDRSPGLWGGGGVPLKMGGVPLNLYPDVS